MTAVVGILDRDSWLANTDNIVFVDERRRRLVWVPRDLWSEAVGDRVNAAFARGGHALFRAALGEHGLHAEASVVLLRSSVERALAGVTVTVPVHRRRRYWYPLAPTLRLEDGRKLVAFDPPQETLAGERIHQWIGARLGAGEPLPLLPDLDRIERQQLLVRALLVEGFDFSSALREPDLVSVDRPGALDALTTVRADWAFETVARLRPATVEGKMVLVRRRRLERFRR